MGEDARLDDFLTDEQVEDATDAPDAGPSDAPDGPDRESPDGVDDAAAEAARDTSAEATDDTSATEPQDGSDRDAQESTGDTSANAIAVAEPTARWRPEAIACERCGSDARRLWDDGGTLVCADCTTWRR